ncbi:MAG: diguanylate cyclase [Candidatus Omnitrophota bacterium]
MIQNKYDNLKPLCPILVAEDNVIARKYLEKVLINAGYTVVSAENGQEAVELFSKRFFPIVLTDWMMPEMNGLEVCKFIRERPQKRYVFIVLLTANDTKEDIITGLEAGADDYLTKPINHAELIARLNSGMRILELEKNLRDANEKIKILSITDPLTGCFNRGYMNKKLTQEIKRAKRYEHPLSVVFSDIDHFKSINDTYGHPAGDFVLKEFSQCILSSIRVDLDWLTRYGGEEFLIVLPETNLEGALCVAERIRMCISGKEIMWDNQCIRLTASFGVTGLDTFGGEPFELTPEALISQADKNLYQSKKMGRNRTTVSSYSR